MSDDDDDNDVKANFNKKISDIKVSAASPFKRSRTDVDKGEKKNAFGLPSIVKKISDDCHEALGRIIISKSPDQVKDLESEMSLPAIYVSNADESDKDYCSSGDHEGTDLAESELNNDLASIITKTIAKPEDPFEAFVTNAWAKYKSTSSAKVSPKEEVIEGEKKISTGAETIEHTDE